MASTSSATDAAAPESAAAFAPRGSNQSGMRAHNARLVLSLVRHYGALSKSEIARRTGLSAQTISVIMRELEQDALLLKGDPIRGKVGQPSIPMALAPNGAFFFGLQIGRRSAELVLIDFLGTVRGRIRTTHRFPTPDSMIDFALGGIETLSADLPQGSVARISGLGIAMPFRIWDWAEIIGLGAAEMDAWRTRRIDEELAERLLYPVYLQNDATAACGAELVFGANPAPNTFLHIYIAYFIGGGVVLNNALFTGQTGNAGAIGSMPVPGRDGRTVQLIDVASIAGIEAALEAAGAPTASIWEGPEAWRVPPDVLETWIGEASTGLAHAIAASASVLDFEQVMIDGWIPARLRADLVAATRSALQGINPAGLHLPQVVEGSVGADARPLGAASLPLSDRFLLDGTAALIKG